MKIIEALKKTKDLQRKAEDLREKIRRHCVYLSMETPTYPDQTAKVSEWLQSHSDTLKEILRLRIAIQKTNLQTGVTLELEGKHITKTIAEWIHRRRDLAGYELKSWNDINDRGLKEGSYRTPSGSDMEVKIIRCFDPAKRDQKVSDLSSEPSLIDAKLEIANAITDLIE